MRAIVLEKFGGVESLVYKARREGEPDLPPQGDPWGAPRAMEANEARGKMVVDHD